MVVGSSAGSSAAAGTGSVTGSRSSASTRAVPPPSRATSATGSPARAAFTAAAVHPVHHRRSTTVPGPNARSQRATRARRASSTLMVSIVAPNHRSTVAHRYCELIQLPLGRPRTIRPSRPSRTSTRDVMATVPP
jgi:hypothetical protein